MQREPASPGEAGAVGRGKSGCWVCRGDGGLEVGSGC